MTRLPDLLLGPTGNLNSGGPAAVAPSRHCPQGIGSGPPIGPPLAEGPGPRGKDPDGGAIMV